MALRSLRRVLAARPEPVPAHEVCAELRDAPTDAVPLTPDGCQECLELEESWVHLRMCLACGHVGCCDTGTTATRGSTPSGPGTR